MSRYRITEADKVYAAEFKRNLEADNWFHSPGLQRVLNAMRGGPGPGKYVLVVERALSTLAAREDAGQAW